MRALAITMVAAAASASLAAQSDYTSSGPCTPTSRVQTPFEAGDQGRTVKLDVTVTVPHESAALKPPYSLIFFFNGFQARKYYYEAYAERLASWGFAVVQYDVPLFHIVKDGAELKFLGPLLDWLREQNASEAGALSGRLDLSRVGVAGHSRGAKVAALHFADDQRVRAAYLVDPVDNTAFTPESEDYPSAVRALQRAHRPVGVTGAGLIGRCNPSGSNFNEFWGAAAGGSWLTVARQSSHTEFLNAGGLLNRVIAALCGCRGRNSPQETLRLTAPPLVAWMESQLRPGDAAAQARVAGFLHFAAAKEAAGAVDFSVKQGLPEQQPVPGGVVPAADVGSVGSDSVVAAR